MFHDVELNSYLGTQDRFASSSPRTIARRASQFTLSRPALERRALMLANFMQLNK